MVYYSTVEAGKLLGVSARTASRAAKRAGRGIYLRNGRLVAVHADDMSAVKKEVHGVAGNPQFGRTRIRL